MSVQEMAAKGRYGDSIVAHLTPGEVTVPPEILMKFPQLKAAIAKAMGQMGVHISQFTAGSPNVVTNPATGAPEQSIWGALLPVIGGVLGTILLPGVGTALGAGAAAGAVGGAVGGGLGGLAGSAIDHTNPALGALGGAVGGGIGGAGGFSGAGDLLSGAGAAGASGYTVGAGGASAGYGGLLASPDAAAGSAAESAGVAASPASFAPGAVGAEAANPGWLERNLGITPNAVRAGGYAGLGSSLAGMFGPTGSSSSSSSSGQNNDPNANNPNALVPPAGSTPNSLLGNNIPNTPTFAGFSPQTAGIPGNSFNFYPQPGTNPFQTTNVA